MNLRRFVAAFIVMAVCSLEFSGNPPQQAGPKGQEKDITINEDDRTTTVDCRGRAVTVTGDDNTIRLNGECSKLTVTGDDNTINAKAVTEIAVSGYDNTIVVETVAKISTKGDDNRVTWTKGAGGKRPEISDTGDDNTTKQAGN